MGAGEIVMPLRAILFLTLLFTALRGAAATNAFDAANRLYEQGKFSEAAAAYENMTASGTATASVWFNLGNAHYKAGHLGRAIAAFRVAERLTPRDEALRANLQFVRGKVYGDERAHVPWWKNALRLATVNEWTVATVASLWAFFSVLACAELTGRRYTKTAMALLALGLVTGTGTALAWDDYRKADAVVAAREATVRFGPLDESQSAFQLRDGVELAVVGAKDQWLEIRDPEKRTGWIRRDEVVVVR